MRRTRPMPGRWLLVIACLGLFGCGAACLRARRATHTAHVELEEGYALVESLPPEDGERALRKALAAALDEVALLPAEGRHGPQVRAYQHALIELADRLDRFAEAGRALAVAVDEHRERERARVKTGHAVRAACEAGDAEGCPAALAALEAPSLSAQREALEAVENGPALAIRDHLMALKAVSAARATLAPHKAAVARARDRVMNLAARERDAHRAVVAACSE